ncbi:type VII secretion protein EccE [Mycobacterium sp. shizuoka-1]|uniref:type VII secretion protein EccE n=1 Tax=Mycobacterium sp. shizuoka-1 TaxID=2039281 RepID=UPI000C063A75|nr:type VII secretion protein EccE [Mycobacterium sp. shizuoka-1]GAY17428.1 type VII secretion protein EccE [Mycobacterium sp. shizuoka-1]
MTGMPGPGAGRLTVVVLAAVAAVLAYPWRSPDDRWVLAITAVAVIVALARWRGRYLTATAADWLRLMLTRKPIGSAPPDLRCAGADAVATVLVRVDCRDRELPMDLLAGYLDRFGLRCDAVRVTTHRTETATATWVGLTVSGARNLAALQGRSAQLPLRQTAEGAARRLIGQLRETGWTATLADPAQLPELVSGDARERWRSVTDARGHLTAYAAGAPDALAAVSPAGGETWTVVEISGTRSAARTRAAAAIRTHDRPDAVPPGLTAIPGRQAGALAALHPLSGVRLAT